MDLVASKTFAHSMEEATTTDASTATPWKTRSVAENLLLQRGIVGTTPATTTATTATSSHFDVDTCLSRMRRDKAAVVRTAFTTAATTVLNTIAQQAQSQRDTDTITPNSIPVVQHVEQLEDLRVTSLTRAFDNKNIKKTSSTTATTASTTFALKKPPQKQTTKKTPSKKPTTTDTSLSLTAASPTTSSAAAANIDARCTTSRAILCAAATICFEALTPPLVELDVLDVPQNTQPNNNESPSVNMGAVLLQAQTLGQRATVLARNAARRCQERHDYRKLNAMEFLKEKQVYKPKNPFATEPAVVSEEENDHVDSVPNQKSLSEQWKHVCLPRFMSVLKMGTGHALYYEKEWKSRHGRMEHLLQQFVSKENNYGPHLIVTTQPQVQEFVKQFEKVNSHLQFIQTSATTSHKLRALAYTGSPERLSKLRNEFMSKMTGLPNAPAHVLVTSYTTFLENYVDFCQVPFQIVLLDDGVSWLSCAHADPNGTLAALWEGGVWSASDAHVGLAGTPQWHLEDSSSKKKKRNVLIGLTARYRIMSTRTLAAPHKDALQLSSVPGLLHFCIPQFTNVVREEWDRSRITQDAASMDHFRKLLARCIIVHDVTLPKQDLYEMAWNAIKGISTSIEEEQENDNDEQVPSIIPDETFVSAGKVSQSRRSALVWLGPPSQSWLRYELGKASLEDIIETMKQSSVHGQVCEEIVTASSTTSSGAGGTVSGTQAYRLAVRCGRNFGSEQGLRQHMAALHAPPGTWLCRTCGGDCGTSQARTHHERSCGQPATGAQGNPAGGGVSTVGQGVRPGGKQLGPTGVVGKKSKGASSSGAALGKSVAGETSKDKDGSFRVPGYRGVWVNTAGKHFCKIDGTPFNDDDVVLKFDSIEEAARKYDEIVSEQDSVAAELNFRPDGTRIVYEESAAAAAAGRGLDMLGGGTSSVVPALSVINIKDLPNHVKPLLRDPRQTSRTGGNSKRHVYAYRGVCRQARKGHDRWQSQISFGGTNHYLGTFDSEWDAAAIYAWAHLILYGEEATKKAQKEGEEAAAAYEQEKKDIAAGKIVAPPPKPAKKKAAKKKEKKGSSEEKGDTDKSAPPSKKIKSEEDGKASKKRPAKASPAGEKKSKAASKASGPKGDNASIAPILAKGVAKAPVLAPRQAFKDISDDDLARSASQMIMSARSLGYCVSDTAAGLPAPIEQELRPCTPIQSSSSTMPSGNAILLGLSGSLFAWTVDSFVHSNSGFSSISEDKRDVAALSLNREYGRGGVNERFRTVLQGSVCLIGRASLERERASESLGLGSVPLGGTCGEMDCNIGGVAGSCSETAAVIQKSSSGGSSDFVFFATNNRDMVSLNGRQVKAEMGSFPLFNEDVCTVGARVFVFLLPMDA